MRTLFQALTELLRDEGLLQRERPIVLREEAENSRSGETTLDRAGRALVLRPQPWAFRDHRIPTNRWLFPLFRSDLDDPPLCRSCDFVIFHVPDRDVERLFVFLCELKSGKSRGSRDQVRNTKLIADYILAVMRLHGRVESWPRIEFRGLIFAGAAPPQKGFTKISKGAVYEADPMIPDLSVTLQRAGERYELPWFCN